MKLKSTLFILIMLASCALMRGASPDENVVISSDTEEYRFSRGNKGVKVSHSIIREYQATRRGEKIQPYIFHSNIVTLDKASGGKAQYRNANSPTVFHDDSKVCYFNITLGGKDSKAKVQFKRTFTDAAHFTGMFPAEDYPVRSKKIIYKIPASLPDIQLIDRNFPAEGITRAEQTAADGSRTITYTAASLPEIPDDPCKPSALSSLAHIMVKGYFPDCDSLYRYHRQMLDVDTVIPAAGSIIAEVCSGANSRDEMISRLYRYVQQTIRYVAFEAGEAAYRPDSPAEVLRKRYGDCKGMSLLLCTLLNRAGIEAYIACTGTDKIPFRISDALSLSASDHMICVVPDSGSYLFLDPTHKQISARHIPQWICGKDAMAFLPDGYTMIDIPERSPLASADSLCYDYRLTPDGLTGIAYRICTEDVAERFFSKYSDVPGQHLNELLAKSMIPMSRASVVPDSIAYDTSAPGRISISAPIINPSAITAADNAIYLDLNTSGDPLEERIDTDGRKSDYIFPMTCSITSRSTVELPDEAEPTLPPDFRMETPQADFICVFAHEGNKVSMTKTITVKKTLLPLAEIPSWNKNLSGWKDACNQQIEINLK